MKSDFIIALTQLAAERNLPRETVLSAIETALVSAFRKDSITEGQDLSVKLDPGSGEITVHILKTVVEHIEDPQTEISLKEARTIRAEAQIGESVSTDNVPNIAGRIAAQTAKQVVMQRLREAEREIVYNEYSERSGEVFSVTLQRMEARQIIVDLGRAEAILPFTEQAPTDRYRPGLNFKVLLKSVERSIRGPELIVSRTDSLLLRRLFEMEVPEIFNGSVEIVAIAREAGFRSKVAVRAKQESVDAVGSCVGLRGVRIQNIVNELQGEKIDVVEWSKDASRFIANSLNPSQVIRVDLDQISKAAVAVVPDRQLSLAIGKEGQNARLAAKLTGWKVDIRSNVEADQEATEISSITADSGLERLKLSTRSLNILKTAKIITIGQVFDTADEELLGLKGFGQKSFDELQERIKNLDLSNTVVETAKSVEEPESSLVDKPKHIEVEVDGSGTDAEALKVEEPIEPVESYDPVQDLHSTADDESKELAKVATTEEAEEPKAASDETSSPDETDQPTIEKLPDLTTEILDPVIESEPVPTSADGLSSIEDLPENTWSLKRSQTSEPGKIRFAEDIAGLRGGVMARRGRTGEGGDGGRRRKSKSGKKRR